MVKYFAIMCFFLTVQIMLFSGCSKKQTMKQPSKLVIYRQSSFNQDVYNAQIAGFFTGIGLTVKFVSDPIPKPAPNEINVCEEYNADENEAGNSSGGNDHLTVSPEKIRVWYDTEEESIIKKMVAFTFAHEIGHVYLGTGLSVHKVGSTNNVMTDKLSNVHPMLQQCQWPWFDVDQANKIGKCLGY